MQHLQAAVHGPAAPSSVSVTPWLSFSVLQAKAKVSDSEYIHFRAFQPLGGKPLELQSSQFGQTRDAAL